MTEQEEQQEPITVDDPAQFAVAVLGRKAADWINKRRLPAGVVPVLLIRPPVHGLDLTTGRRLIEVRGDIVDGRSAPLQAAKVFKKLYSSIEVCESRGAKP